MAPYIDAYFALTLVIIGLSHAAQPRLWAEFFNSMKRTGYAPLIIGMYHVTSSSNRLRIASLSGLFRIPIGYRGKSVSTM